MSATVVPKSRSRLDAIVVPTARPSSSLKHVIALSARLSVPLVVLCSKYAQVERVAERVGRTFGARALVVEVPRHYQLPDGPELTSAERFREASFDRASDLSVKRNLGLLLGRMLGWNSLLFVDDDITQFKQLQIERLTSVLDRHPVASMVSREFPDNSVVCHARRLAGLAQDVFVSGASLGVNLRHPNLSFFPDIYNEDWLFFARHAAARSLPKIGEVKQAEYLPFYDPERAAREEFGDLLAEGLYALFERTPGWEFKEQLAAAGRKGHWEDFAASRRTMIQRTMDRLTQAEYSVDNRTVLDAEESLRKARKQAQGITPELCVDFIESWQEDELHWQRVLGRYTSVLSEPDALSELGLEKWISYGYGAEVRSAGPWSDPEPEAELPAAGAVLEGLALQG
ncbi:hypothetical protein AB0L70_08770 [Kribbella sp. NPDC051952]|uniref:hypothetical protein n=1 Tax=Kribbella sp. NPDC051952 TaxID=3154851 RepID=UPI003432A531